MKKRLPMKNWIPNKIVLPKSSKTWIMKKRLQMKNWIPNNINVIPNKMQMKKWIVLLPQLAFKWGKENGILHRYRP